MKFTRRDISKLALGTALVSQASPAAAFLHNRATPESIAEHLTTELNAALKPGCAGQFTVVNLKTQDVPFWAIDAVIQLDWPPGTRRLPFFGTGDDADEAVDKVLAKSKAYFREAWTYPDGQSGAPPPSTTWPVP